MLIYVSTSSTDIIECIKANEIFKNGKCECIDYTRRQEDGECEPNTCEENEFLIKNGTCSGCPLYTRM